MDNTGLRRMRSARNDSSAFWPLANLLFCSRYYIFVTLPLNSWVLHGPLNSNHLCDDVDSPTAVDSVL